MALFEELSCNLAGEIKDKMKNPDQDTSVLVKI
jgi:hypothetical protein